MKILSIEHVAIAVESLGETAQFFHEVLQLGDRTMETVADQGVLTDIYNTSRGKVELLEPVGSDSPIAKFLDKRGSGLHHIALEVDDLAAWLVHLKAQGVELIDDTPRIGAEGYRIAFIHPRATGGVLVELCQKP